MAYELRRHALPGQTPGQSRHLLFHCFGEEGKGPKAYLQASLHADETPAMLVAHHLLRLLLAAEARGAITGRIVLVPYANPLGLAQALGRDLSGRYELAGGGNFNRNWPALAEPVAARLQGRLGADAAANVAAIRAALRAVFDEMQPRNALDHLRVALGREACDADLVLDMHCDDEALLHLFLLPQHWPEARDLAAELGAEAVLLAEDSGGASFDESFSWPWVALARRFPGHPIPPACLASTLEFRGRGDVDDATAEADAAALFRVLQRRGLIAGDPGPLPPLKAEATDLAATDSVKAPAAGILAYRVGLGERVAKGQLLAELVDPAAEDPAAARREIRAATDGLLLSQRYHKYVFAGDGVAKVVGREPLPHRVGYLLED